MPAGFEGRAFVPGRYGSVCYRSLQRQEVEHLLRSWFVWLSDRSRIHLAPASGDMAAEFYLRRWKTKPHLVLFRWRNADTTKHVFEAVRVVFERRYPESTIERTPASGRPRALVLSFPLAEVQAPSWALSLAVRAFEAAGESAVDTFDLRCNATVLENPSADVPLEPTDRAWESGYRLGSTLGRGIEAVPRRFTS